MPDAGRVAAPSPLGESTSRVEYRLYRVGGIWPTGKPASPLFAAKGSEEYCHEQCAGLYGPPGSRWLLQKVQVSETVESEEWLGVPCTP